MSPPRLSVVLVSALIGCGRPAAPPDPPILTQQKCDDPALPFFVESVEIEHVGCPGPCPAYRVRVTSQGDFEYEGKKFVRETGYRSARGYPSDVIPLFAWLCEHPTLYAKSGGAPNGVDTEELTYRFGLRDGRTVVVQSDIGFQHDDLWVLSSLVDGVVGRVLMGTREEKGTAE
jgi:hypothetical protein